MYENPNEFERALLLFCNRVDIICAMEMSHKITAEHAYKEIKAELKELKRAKKQYGKDM
jgi:hypothetical protein